MSLKPLDKERGELRLIKHVVDLGDQQKGDKTWDQNHNCIPPSTEFSLSFIHETPISGRKSLVTERFRIDILGNIIESGPIFPNLLFRTSLVSGGFQK